MRRRTRITFGISAAALLILAAPVRRVSGAAMAPSIEAGDWVWVLPGMPIRQGDVVALDDPLDPERVILRRAIAPGHTTTRFDDAGVRVDSKRLRQKDMGKRDGYGVYQEVLWGKPPARSVEWLIRRQRAPAVRWKAEPVEVPEGHWYLLADDRDDAIDSRWWGPIAETEIHGVVRARLGPAHLWRPGFAWLEGAQ